MAVALDASTPARWSGAWNTTNGGSITSDSFTAPADAFLVLTVEYDTSPGGGSVGSRSVSDSGGLTWTNRVEREGLETTAGAGSAIFTARTTSAVARTVTFSGGVGNGGMWATGRASAKLYVFTGVDVDGTPVDAVGASNEGGSSTNNLTTSSVTPGATGVLVVADAEWNALGTFEASTDLTQDTAHYAGELSVCSGYKACSSGVGVTANLNAAGTSAAQHKWCQIVVREAAGGGGGRTSKNTRAWPLGMEVGMNWVSSAQLCLAAGLAGLVNVIGRAAVRIGHWMRKEKSGLAFTTLELVQAEERRGHAPFLREPTDARGLPGKLLYGPESLDCDVECVHSQMPLTSYFDRRPKFLWMHGEPLSSVGNGVSMKAIVDMAPKVDAFVAMRKEEWAVWNTIKRTHVVRKGIDLGRFRPVPVAEHDPKDPRSKLSGAPAVLYAEHWRGQRNPLYLCVAMERVWRRYPDARLHLFNCGDPKMHDTFRALHQHNKWWAFLRTITGPVPDADVNLLYNRADVAVSCLYPLYARSIEAFGAGKPLVCPGYRDPEYPWRCELDPDSLADAVCAAWEGRADFDARRWAERKHDVMDTVAECEDVYRRYL